MDNKPFKYPEGATPEQVGKLAERLERGRQMSGQRPDLTKQEIRRKKPYNRACNINKNVKVDIESISKGISNYIELTKGNETKRSENFDRKFRDPDMDRGIGALTNQKL